MKVVRLEVNLMREKSKRFTTFRLIAIAGLLLFVRSPLAQDAVPGEILGRTILIRAGNEQGTAFSIDHDGGIYLVTARHVVAGLPKTNAIIKVRKQGEWTDLQIPKILFPKSDSVDIAVIKTDEKITKPYGIACMSGTSGPTMGQQVWFLGYPFLEGLETRTKSVEAPFIKRGTMSAVDGTDQDAILFYIDGFNNEGFSGGPILYWDFGARRYEILGVVMGYRNDLAQINVNGRNVKTNILVNSGILLGYSIDHAIQAIESDKDEQR